MTLRQCPQVQRGGRGGGDTAHNVAYTPGQLRKNSPTIVVAPPANGSTFLGAQRERGEKGGWVTKLRHGEALDRTVADHRTAAGDIWLWIFGKRRFAKEVGSLGLSLSAITMTANFEAI